MDRILFFSNAVSFHLTKVRVVDSDEDVDEDEGWDFNSEIAELRRCGTSLWCNVHAVCQNMLLVLRKIHPDVGAFT